MFLGMPGLNGDSYSASQVRWPISHRVGLSQTWFPSLQGMRLVTVSYPSLLPAGGITPTLNGARGLRG